MPSAASRDGSGSNYTITYANGTLTVNPAALDHHGQQREQDLRPDGDLRQHRVHGRPAWCNGDTISGVTETSTGRGGDGGGRDRPHRAQRRDVLGRACSNYTITYANGTLTVNPAALDHHGQQHEQDLRPDGTFAGTAFTTPAWWATATRSAA